MTPRQEEESLFSCVDSRDQGIDSGFKGEKTMSKTISGEDDVSNISPRDGNNQQSVSDIEIERDMIGDLGSLQRSNNFDCTFKQKQ